LYLTIPQLLWGEKPNLMRFGSQAARRIKFLIPIPLHLWSIAFITLSVGIVSRSSCPSCSASCTSCPLPADKTLRSLHLNGNPNPFSHKSYRIKLSRKIKIHYNIYLMSSGNFFPLIGVSPACSALLQLQYFLYSRPDIFRTGAWIKNDAFSQVGAGLLLVSTAWFLRCV